MVPKKCTVRLVASLTGVSTRTFERKKKDKQIKNKNTISSLGSCCIRATRNQRVGLSPNLPLKVQPSSLRHSSFSHSACHTHSRTGTQHKHAEQKNQTTHYGGKKCVKKIKRCPSKSRGPDARLIWTIYAHIWSKKPRDFAVTAAWQD